MHFSRLLTIITVIIPTIAGAPLESKTGSQRRQPHVLSLSRKSSIPSQRSRYLDIQRSRYLDVLQPHGSVNATVGSAIIKGLGEILYTANITFGTRSIEAIVDTGSADTWAIGSGFQCVGSSEIVPEAQCGFGPPVTTTSPTFKQIQGQNFKIGYEDGEEVTGIVGTETVTLAGITVKNQEVGIVNHAYWNGDNSSSGLIGLAFPNLTSAYRGNDPKVDKESDAVPYSPLFTSMYTQGLVAPVFSIAINRRGEETGGLLALGGLPPVNHSNVFACTPLKMTATRRPGSGVNGTTIDTPQYKFYSIIVDGLVTRAGNTSVDIPVGSNRPSDDAPYNMHVDTGSTIIYLPEEAADTINDLFVPRAEHNYRKGQYDVDCGAKAPDLAVKIAGQAFHINPVDLVVKATDGSCFSGVTATYSQQGVLGDVFLRNVVAVFDIGHLEMRFAAREFY
ncbi:MAG: hypothetical protein L6R42_005663 [Xanthoria sp. 1 TBL-2021]|nr:MAG: hypothetical protein L6R42_005663 [Xanthoria sp. 1 TBL-2021]